MEDPRHMRVSVTTAGCLMAVCESTDGSKLGPTNAGAISSTVGMPFLENQVDLAYS